jgi:uncharacterized protein YcbK (DUF882 family)
MSKVSKHFSRSEFACKCGCGFNTVDVELVGILESIRQRFDKPITVTSGCRCVAHNEAEGGGSKSQHLIGRAADIIVHGVEPDAVAAFADIGCAAPGLGRYSTFTHIDSRDEQARWED